MSPNLCCRTANTPDVVLAAREVRQLKQREDLCAALLATRNANQLKLEDRISELHVKDEGLQEQLTKLAEDRDTLLRNQKECTERQDVVRCFRVQFVLLPSLLRHAYCWPALYSWTSVPSSWPKMKRSCMPIKMPWWSGKLPPYQWRKSAKGCWYVRTTCWHGEHPVLTAFVPRWSWWRCAQGSISEKENALKERETAAKRQVKEVEAWRHELAEKEQALDKQAAQVEAKKKHHDLLARRLNKLKRQLEDNNLR